MRVPSPAAKTIAPTGRRIFKAADYSDTAWSVKALKHARHPAVRGLKPTAEHDEAG
jgi:hypothetical protein